MLKCWRQPLSNEALYTRTAKTAMMSDEELSSDETNTRRNILSRYNSVRASSPTGQYAEDINHSQSISTSSTTQSDATSHRHHSRDSRTFSETIELNHLQKDSSLSSSPQNLPKSSGSSPIAVLYPWRWELSIWLLGTAGLIANIALLIRFDGVEQSAWKANVQITAFAAALAQLSQTALLVPTGSSLGQLKWKWLQRNRKAIDLDRFDLASRGPDGSLRLLWHLKLRPHLATVGALCTLLMLAFSTFVQQSVAVNTRRFRVEDGNASYVHLATDMKALSVLPTATRESAAVLQAMLTSYLNPANVTGHCSTDICTWDPYRTLSICATVEDATSQLIAGNMSTDNERLPPQIPGATANLSPELHSNTSMYTYVERLTDSVGYGDDGSLGPKDTPSTGLPDAATIYLIYYDYCKEADAGHSQFSQEGATEYWTAFKANFHICLQTFNTTFEGQWQASIVDSVAHMDWYWRYWGEMMLLYCTSLDKNLPDSRKNQTIKNDDIDDFCVSHGFVYDVGHTLNQVYNISKEIHKYEYEGVLNIGEENADTSPSAWTELLGSDVREFNTTSIEDDCNRKSFENFSNRIQRMAASLSLEMHNAESAGIDGVNRTNGTAWRTGK